MAEALGFSRCPNGKTPGSALIPPDSEIHGTAEELHEQRLDCRRAWIRRSPACRRVQETYKQATTDPCLFDVV